MAGDMSPSPSSPSERAYLFVGGPWDQRRVKTGGLKTFRVPIPNDDLSGWLKASLDVMEKGMAALPNMRIAEYQLERRVPLFDLILFDPQVYHFIGWEK